MTTLTTTSAVAVLDSPRQWRRDGAVLGAVAGLGGGAVVVGTSEPMLIPLLVASGALSGVAVAGPARRLLDGLRRRVPLWAIAPVMPLVGAVWGAAAVSGFLMLIGLFAQYGPDLGEALVLGTLIGAPIGAALVGLLWLPHAVTAVMRLPRWPLLAATLALSSASTFFWMERVFRWLD